MSILETRGVTKRFGGLSAVDNVTIQVPEGSIYAIIGPNGAGKTTLYNCITGFYPSDEGDMLFQGKSLVGLSPDRITKKGISRTYQNIRLFPAMTALENILVGAHPRLKSNLFDAFLHTPRQRAEEKEALEKAQDLLNFVGLKGEGDLLARNLPYGAQRRLEMARALANDPKIILLDEPTAGMNPNESVIMMRFIQNLRDELGITILLIEHDMKVVMGISEFIYVLDFGQLIAKGTPGEIQKNPQVIESYLGRGAADQHKQLSKRIYIMAMLEVKNIHTYYGNIHALKGVSITVEEKEIVTLIGGNGAGKTTTLRSISGLVPPRVGEIFFEGENITKTPAHELVYKGITMVPEGRGIFARLSVFENLDMGAYSQPDRSTFDDDLDRVYQLFPRLKEREKQVSGTLSGGEQQMLATARALMANPRLLLMDEPSMGLAPILVESVFETIQAINKTGTTILLVEQNATVALAVADRGYVLQTGEIVLKDTAENLRKDEMVQKAYLGID